MSLHRALYRVLFDLSDSYLIFYTVGILKIIRFPVICNFRLCFQFRDIINASINQPPEPTDRAASFFLVFLLLAFSIIYLHRGSLKLYNTRGIAFTLSVSFRR